MNIIQRFENAEIVDGVTPTRVANATLISGRSTPMTRSELATLPSPVGSDTHKPIPHIELIRSIEHTLSDEGILITAEKFSVNREGNALFGVMDLKGGTNVLAANTLAQNPEFTAAMGIRTANDKTMSLQLGVGAKVFICDNLAFHADMIAMKRKHTSGLDLIGELKDAVKRFIEKFWKFSCSFESLKNQELLDREAKQRIYDIFAKGLLAPKYFPAVHAGYFASTGEEYAPQYAGTAWALHNAFTWALKPAPLPVQQRATLELAREFQLAA